MARFCLARMGSLQLRVRYNRGGVCYKDIFNGFCSQVESPEIPNWFKLMKRVGSYDLDSDDDFVLPTAMYSLEHKRSSSYETHDRLSNVKLINQEITDPDVDEVSEILKANFISPGLVVKALDSCSFAVSTQLVDKILKRFSNDWVCAFGFFLWADTQTGYKHSCESYDTIVDILGKFKQFDLMWGLLEELAQIGNIVSLVTMTKVMRRLAGACRWYDAINTFRNLERFGVKKNTESLNVLLDTLCKERSVKRAKEAFLEFRSEIPPNPTCFNVLIHGWCKARKIKEARETMLEMKEFGFNPCVITYTSLIEVYCLEKNFQMVYVILDEMKLHGCSPNIVTYTIIMHNLGKANEVEKAMNIFDTAKKESCVPDTSFYNSLIYILSKAGRLQDANDVFEEMCKNGTAPNVTTYNTLISANCHSSHENYAFELLLKMEKSSCEPEIKTYAPILKLCCRKGWIKILLYLLGHMFKKDISPDYGTYILLINGLCRNGKLVHACLFFKEMVLKGFVPRQFTYDKLLEALGRRKMYSAMENIKELMMHAENFRKTGDYSFHKQELKEG